MEEREEQEQGRLQAAVPCDAGRFGVTYLSAHLTLSLRPTNVTEICR